MPWIIICLENWIHSSFKQFFIRIMHIRHVKMSYYWSQWELYNCLNPPQSSTWSEAGSCHMQTDVTCVLPFPILQMRKDTWSTLKNWIPSHHLFTKKDWNRWEWTKAANLYCSCSQTGGLWLTGPRNPDSIRKWSRIGDGYNVITRIVPLSEMQGLMFYVLLFEPASNGCGRPLNPSSGLPAS